MTNTHDKKFQLAKKSPWILILLRISIGILFFFSGILKANDPIGLSEKMQEILHSWSIFNLDQWTIYTSIVVICVEVVLGLALLLSFHKKIVITVAWIIIGFFTLLTGVAHFTKTVDTCGCFGDCIPLSTHQSFIKNCILFVLLAILFAYRNHLPPSKIKQKYSLSILIGLSILTLFMSWWALQHLPFIDCSTYKKGTNILAIQQKNNLPYLASFEEYKMYDQKKDTIQIWDGAQFYHWKIIENPNYVWLNPTDELDSLSNIPFPNFALYSEDLIDFTNIILKDPGYHFLFLLNDVQTASTQDLETIRALIITAEKHNIGFYIVSSSNQKNTQEFIQTHQLNHSAVLYMDLLSNQKAIRTNPGLIIIKSGTVLGKWGFNEYPSEIEWKNDNAIKVK